MTTRTLMTLCLLLTSVPAGAQQDREHEPELDWSVPHLHSLAVVGGTRLSLSLIWPEAYAVRPVSANWDRFCRAWTTEAAWDGNRGFFEWDGDPWALNLVGHGLMGSEFYLRYRQYGGYWWQALGMTLLWTLAWEYLVESWHKQPSGIDLAWTPLGGALLGEGRYRLYLEVRDMADSPLRHLLLYLVDPLGQLERDAFGLEY